jgi:hypothetical protein
VEGNNSIIVGFDNEKEKGYYTISKKSPNSITPVPFGDFSVFSKHNRYLVAVLGRTCRRSPISDNYRDVSVVLLRFL